MPPSLLRLLALSACAAAASATVLGIDLGSDFVKVALVSPGQAFQIVGNVNSKRKTSTTVSFYQGDRLFEADAESLLARRPRQVFHAPHRLLGKNLSHPSVADYVNNSFYATSVAANARGGIDFVVPGEWRKPAPGSAAAIKEEAEAAAALAAAGPEGAEAVAAAAAAAAAEPTLFSVEEMVAQLFIHIKDFTELHAGGGLKVRDVVLTVPSYWTQNERMALLDAADLAGLKVLALIDENVAAGVHYGIDRVTENGTHYMLLYNMGDEDTEATLFAYDSYQAFDKATGKPKAVGQGRVIAKAWDATLGGRQFDKALVEYVADCFNRDKGGGLPAAAKGDVRNLPGSMVKIKKNTAKAVEVLSANEEYSLVVESLHGDVDYRLQVSRAILEKAAEKAGLWARVTSVLDDLLLQSQLPLVNVSVVEVVGGGVRMPKVQAILKDYLAAAQKAAAGAGPSLGVHLNGDEVMALGAAFAAANRSAAFRVRRVGMIDGFPFPIGVRLSHLDPAAAAAAAAAAEAPADDDAEGAEAAPAVGKPWVKRSSLFRPYNPLDSVKRISFTAGRDLRATLFYENATAAGSGAPPLPEGTSRTLGVYSISGIDALLANETVQELGAPLKVHISFELDVHGIASVLKAEATQEVETLVAEPVATPKPAPKATAAPNATAANATSANATAANGTATSATVANATEANTTDLGGSAATAIEGNATAANATEPIMRVVKKTYKYPLAVVLDAEATAMQVRSMSAADKNTALARLRRLKAADDEKKQLDGAKNALEAFVYAVRERREAEEEPLASVTTEEQRDALSGALMEVEEWLYGDGVAADFVTYRSKLAEVRGAVDPVFARLDEFKARPKLVNTTTDTFAAWRSMLGAWGRTHPQISPEELLNATEAVLDLEAWFNDTVELQAAQADSDPPVLTRAATDARLRPVSELLQRLHRRPRPTPTPLPKAKPNATNATEDAAGGVGSDEEREEGEDAAAYADAAAEAEAEMAAADEEVARESAADKAAGYDNEL